MPRFGRHMLEHWALDPDLTYLNHGVVGAPPRRVLAAQQAIRDEIERQPSLFMFRELNVQLGIAPREQSRLRAAADDVAAFLGARGDDLAFVENATAAAAAVIGSIELHAGDEILTTDHTYGGVANVAEMAARRSGAKLHPVELPYPATRPGEVIDVIDAALGPHTRLAIVDHVTSQSGLVMPVAEIAACCRKKGVPVYVDGAHAPGMLDLDLPALGVDWYGANLHKWAHAPRSCGILWADPGRQGQTHPAVMSWGMDRGFTSEFDWVGTRDPSASLTAPEGIAMLRELDYAEVRRYNTDLAREAARMLTRRWGTRFEPDESMVGAMVTLPMPSSLPVSREDAQRLRDALLFEDRIEVQLHAYAGRLWTRVSAQVYNDLRDIERLGEAVAARA